MRLVVKSYINSHITCSKNLPNTAHHPQLHLEIPKVPFTCIAIDNISKLPTTTSGNKYTLTCIDLLASYILAVPIPNKTAKSVVEAYLSGIFKNRCIHGMSVRQWIWIVKQSNEHCIETGNKCIFSNPYRPQGNSHIENECNFLKRMLTKFLSSADAEWDKILPFACYCFNTIPTADDLESPFFLVHGRDLLEWHAELLGKGIIRYLGNDKGLILFT